MTGVLDDYAALLGDVKARIAGAQTRAALAANRELMRLYWEIGRLIDARQDEEGWGAAVIPRLARDLARELPDAKGFSERNLKRMVQFFRGYPTLGRAADDTSTAIGPQPVAQSPVGAPPGPANAEGRGRAEGAGGAIGPQAVAQFVEGSAGASQAGLTALVLGVPWGHNILLLQRVPDAGARAWYLRRCLAEGWSRDVLGLMIKSEAHTRQGKAVTNFDASLPPGQSDLARQTLKDPYIFDFLALDADYRERELEAGLLAHLERFLLELGVGFAFVGRQHKLTLAGDDFYLDLLFYHLKLRCFVVIELKVGPFKAEYAGKMNLYLNLVDDTLRHPSDAPTIGLVLCQDKKEILAEYALRGLDKPIGVSAYELTRTLPTELASALPTVAEIEAELTAGEEDPA